ncbi:MAG: AMP-binding protein [Acidimicrobiia bacterium]|nr:AMP-binding protein [Acidimicrobiia bacterium]
MGLQLVTRAEDWAGRTALSDAEGTYGYDELLEASARGASKLLAGMSDLAEARVAFMVEPSFRYVRTQWAIWRAGGVAVPLCLTHPAPELEYVLDTTTPTAVVASSPYVELLAPLAAARGIPLISDVELEDEPASLPEVGASRRAMILFTSGTTGRPKGVVTTHANIEAQIASLVEAWEWFGEDRILLTLPLHHVHGIVNVIGCALWSGAWCEMYPSFDPVQVVDRIATGDLTLYMAVPTIYHRLITHLEDADAEDRSLFRSGAEVLRLMVSGSAALPVSVLERWRDLTGHTLLERYGMTEIGMGLSNPYRGERIAGSVGTPLPGVEVRLVDEEDRPIADGNSGEIQVRGPTVFLEYWARPEATEEAFRDDGWFRTGDTAIVDGGRYRILGRSSVDILKSGGEKISALEIEDVLLRHEAVGEAAVVGIEDEEWGQRVVAVVVATKPVQPKELSSWLRASLAPHKIPKEFHFTDSLPRNPLGKTVKPDVVQFVTEQASSVIES